MNHTTQLLLAPPPNIFLMHEGSPVDLFAHQNVLPARLFVGASNHFSGHGVPDTFVHFLEPDLAITLANGCCPSREDSPANDNTLCPRKNAVLVLSKKISFLRLIKIIENMSTFV